MDFVMECLLWAQLGEACGWLRDLTSNINLVQTKYEYNDLIGVMVLENLCTIT